ncbi:MAG TPA: carboxypeptidase-like regulatory domain-containing protein, partial [Vicinamibacterales bacterium]
MGSRRVLAALALVLASILPAAAQTQITTSVIQGEVVDSSGSVLPGVDVEVRNVDTNFTRSVVTDKDGRFVVLQLPTGRYTVTFKLAGFATHVQQDVLVTVGEAARVAPVMKVSGVSETVTVSTRASAVESTRTATASTLDQKTIETTPILGRKFEDLLTLTPGVSVVQGPDGDEITFSGQ